MLSHRKVSLSHQQILRMTMKKHNYYVLREPNSTKDSGRRLSSKYRGYDRDPCSLVDSFNRIDTNKLFDAELRLIAIADYMLHLYSYTMGEEIMREITNYEFALYIAKTFSTYSTDKSTYEVVEVHYLDDEEAVTPFLSVFLGYDVCWDGNVSAIYGIDAECEMGGPGSVLYEYCLPRLNDNCLFQTRAEASEYAMKYVECWPEALVDIRIIALYGGPPRDTEVLC